MQWEGAAAWPGRSSFILNPGGAASKRLSCSKRWGMLGSALSSPSTGCYWPLSFAEGQGLSDEAEGHLPHLFPDIPAVSMHVSMCFPLFLCIAALMEAGREAGRAPACYLITQQMDKDLPNGSGKSGIFSMLVCVCTVPVGQAQERSQPSPVELWSSVTLKMLLCTCSGRGCHRVGSWSWAA